MKMVSIVTNAHVCQDLMERTVKMVSHLIAVVSFQQNMLHTKCCCVTH